MSVQIGQLNIVDVILLIGYFVIVLAVGLIVSSF